MALAFAGSTALAQTPADHLVVTMQDGSVGKQITVHEPDGTIVYSYSTHGGPTERTPTFLASAPQHQRFLVSCPNGSSSLGGSIEVFDYSAYASGGPINHVVSLDVGDKPFHTAVAPDGRVVVCIDGETPGRILLVDLQDPEAYISIEAGQNHATIAFAPTSSGGFDIYASRFLGNSIGSVDIVEKAAGGWARRATAIPLNKPRPHTAVYSSFNQRVYYSTQGELAGFDTQGAHRDELVHAIPTVDGRMTPLLRITPDHRFLVGGLHYDGVPGSFFYKVDLQDDSMATVPSVSCKYYAFAPTGQWIVAGDFNKDPDQQHHQVHVVDLDNMVVARSWDMQGDDASNVGFQAAAFCHEGRYAYLGLHAVDKVMVVDTEDLSSYQTFPTAAAPRWLRTLEVRGAASSVRDWRAFE